VLLKCSGAIAHSAFCLPQTLALSKLEAVDSMSSAAWQMDVKKRWNGDVLILTSAQSKGDGPKPAELQQLDFARLAGLLRYVQQRRQSNAILDCSICILLWMASLTVV